MAVVGGGPAGTAAAYEAAKGGAAVLLLERDREIGMPVRCAEAASVEQIQPFFQVPDSCVVHPAVREEIITSDDGVTRLPENGLAILDRRRFDAYIALLAAEAGARPRSLPTYLTSISGSPA